MPPTTTKRSPSIVGKTQRKTRTSADEGDLEEWKKSKQLLKPKDQLDLPDAELKEVLARVLQTNNPLKPINLVEFDYKQGCFLPLPGIGHMVTAYEYRGTQIHRETDEALTQLFEMGIDPQTYFAEIDAEDGAETKKLEEEIPEQKLEAVEEEEGKKEEEKEQKEEEEEEAKPDKQDSTTDAAGEDEEGEGEAEEHVVQKAKPTARGRPRKLTNQFNFCERAALTYNNPTRSQECQTVPPPKATFAGLVLQWVIYDAYQKDYEVQQLEKELEKERKEKDKIAVGRVKAGKKVIGKTQYSEAVQEKIAESWKVLERMINQNSYNDIAQDYRYWDDPSDEYREDEGTLLPLWKFFLDKTRKNTVTDIEWNPYYYDLFAVSFGFLEYAKPVNQGAVCIFTLKNPSYPDYICMTQSAAISVATHPKFPYMVVVGLFDGNVMVFNVQANTKEAAYCTETMGYKHQGIVWEVKWGPDLPDGELNFYSVAADGKINNWVLMQNDLSVSTVLLLHLHMDPVQGPDGTLIKMRGALSCLRFHPEDPTLYLVGTEIGKIFKCSTAYSSMYLFKYDAHHMPIYRIDFNKFNTDIFISCSADWRIKIWEDKRNSPLFVFDVGASVGDVQWAPYSSTVFAVVTTQGKVYVFDINVNKYKAICEQAVVSKRKNKLTRLTFNPVMPIIIVGDDKGCVTSLKLSPNLRIPCKVPKKQQHLDQFTLQCMKINKLLSLVREPDTLTAPPDTAGTEE